MKYNTQRPPIKLRAYGRSVQLMVDDALQTMDRAERQQKAQKIVETMARLNGVTIHKEEALHKLWHHLAQMADNDLDVDFPIEQPRRETPLQPQALSYPTHSIRLRHYGHYLQQLMEKLQQTPSAQERLPLIRMAAQRMRRNLSEIRGEQDTIGRIAHDIALYTEGKVTAEEVEAACQ